MASAHGVLALAALLLGSHRAGAQCAGDLTGDRTVDGIDLGVVLAAWATGAEPADINDDGTVNGVDLAALLAAWGPCQPATPGWATLVEAAPNPAVVTNPSIRQAMAATGWAWRVRHTATQIEMVLIPPGSFTRGCSPSQQSACVSWESPVHDVTLTQPFYLARCEVTQSQWTAIMGTNPSARQSYPDSPHRPVESVSWELIDAFNISTGLRLPTEAEWEYAYRARTTTALHAMPGFPDGTNDDSHAGVIAWWSGNSTAVPQHGPQVVGQKAANGFGVHDMAGNVFEWVGDWYAEYPGFPMEDPTGPSFGGARVMRGGSWANPPSNLRASFRLYAPPAWNFEWVGFRVARSP